MLNDILAGFYERDIQKLIEEICLFKDEKNLWKTAGTVKNSSGNLSLHIIGGMNHLFGAVLANTAYIRNRDQEFSQKNVARAELVEGLKKLIPLITETLKAVDMDASFPIPFDGAKRSNSYVCVQLALHLNYHLGQVNYLRRVLE